MAGNVEDPAGAAIVGATVTLTNKTTGLTFTQTTNSSGEYRFSNIPPGQGYEVVFSATGFSPLDVKDIYLTVSSVRTQNATLSVGANVSVEVNAGASEVTIDTTDATVGNTLDVKQLDNLPVQERNDPIALFTLQPGVTDTASVTGARVDQNNVTLDGLDVNDFATGGATQNNTGPGVFSQFEIVAHAPIDSVEEFHGGVAGMGADSGPGSGGQFALVTKSGTNQFHGNLNEYHRDPLLVANSWFSNNSSPIVPRNHLIQNQFGGNIGGPVLKNKLFFFFDYNNSRVAASVATQRTVPLMNLRQGNIGYINSTGGTSYLTPSQVQALDPAGIGEDKNWLAAISSRFPCAGTTCANNQNSGDGVNSGGFAFNAPNNDFETNYVGRGDYNFAPNMKLFARFTITRENGIEYPNEFPGDPISGPSIDRSYAFVIGHTWTIGSTKTNQLILGETVQKLSFPITYNPTPTTYLLFGDGTGPALSSSLYLEPTDQSRRVPIPVLGDDFAWTRGNHTWQIGGTFKDILTNSLEKLDYNTVQVGMGGHVLSLCGPNPGCSNPNTGAPQPSMRPSDINSSGNLGNLADYDYDQAFAFALARIGEVSADYNYNTPGGAALPQYTGDERAYRYYQTQLYVADTWKVLPSLTFTYGLNYQYFTVPYEIHGHESVIPFSFDQYFASRVEQSQLSETGPNAVPFISYLLGGKANHGPPLYQPEYRNFAPRFGFAWNPSFDKRSVFNGGAGIIYDRTVINAVQVQQDQYSILFQQNYPVDEGITGDPYDSFISDPRLDKNNGISAVGFTPPLAPVAPYQPYANNQQCALLSFGALTAPCGLQLGSAFNISIDPTLKTPYSIGYNAGWQRELPQNMVFKLSYVGRLGRRLLAQADSNQVLDFADPTSGQLLSQAFAAVTQQLRAGNNRHSAALV